MSEGERPDPAGAPSGSATARRLSVAALLVGGLLALPWLYARFSNVYVYDARVAADVYGLGLSVPGRLEAVHVESGQSVRKGEVLAQLDLDDAELEVAALQSRLAAAHQERDAFAKRLEVSAKAAEASLRRAEFALGAAKADLARHKAMLTSAQSVRDRAEQLFSQQLNTRADLDEARAGYDSAEATVRAAEELVRQRRAEHSKAELELGYREADDLQLRQMEAAARELEAALGRAEERLENHYLRAPVDGVIDKVFGLAGENVLPGQRVIAMHDPGLVWVSANLRETDLHHVRLGAACILRVDAWPDAELSGRVARISQAATNQFSLLPSANPSGNFTKVAQRVELRIEIDDPEGVPLLPGTMVEVVIPIEGR